MTHSKDDKMERFENLYHQFYPYVRSICWNITRHVETTKDVIQESFIAIFGCMDKINSSENPKALIGAIARNRAINYKNKKSHRCEESTEDEQLVNLASKRLSGPLQLIVDRESVDTIYQEMKQMSSTYRDVMILQYIGEMSPEEIARALDMNVKTVYTRLARGREKLKAALAEKQKGAALYAKPAQGKDP